MRSGLLAALLAGLLAPLPGCGGDEEPPVPTEPTRAGLVKVLRDLESAVVKGDYDKALGYMAPFPGVAPDLMKHSLAGVPEREGLTPANIDQLDRQAKYGPLLEVFPERGTKWARRLKLDAEACYALRAGTAEVAAHWDGTGFRILRLDQLYGAGAP